jgi:hypothetical protein
MDRDLMRARSLAQLSYLPLDAICQYCLQEIGDDTSKLADFTAAMDAAQSDADRRAALKHLITEVWGLQCFAMLGTPQQSQQPSPSWISKLSPMTAQPQLSSPSLNTPEQPRAASGQFQLGVGKKKT